MFAVIFLQELLKAYNVPMDLITTVFCVFNFGVTGKFWLSNLCLSADRPPYLPSHQTVPAYISWWNPRPLCSPTLMPRPKESNGCSSETVVTLVYWPVCFLLTHRYADDTLEGTANITAGLSHNIISSHVSYIHQISTRVDIVAGVSSTGRVGCVCFSCF